MKSWESSSLENGLRIPDKVDGYDPDSIYFQVINANDAHVIMSLQIGRS